MEEHRESAQGYIDIGTARKAKLAEAIIMRLFLFLSLLGTAICSVPFQGIGNKLREPLSCTGAITLPDLFREMLLLFL